MESRVVVVTGAAGGQGAAEATLLAREGATVFAADLRAPTLDSPREPGSGSVVPCVLDVTDERSWAALRDRVRERHARIDGLVNNAGIPMRGRLLEVDREDFERALAVNLTGALLGMQALAGLMGEGAAIVNVCSAAALTGHHAAAYTASKWGLRGLSRVAALELGPHGIRVNAIFPGFVETPMTATAPPAFRSANVAATPLGRTGDVDEVAPLVLFLLSGESSYLSGAEIAVDGGMTAHGGAKSIADAVRAEEG